MNNTITNINFVFAVLVHNTGNIAFFTNSTTFGEITNCYKNSRVTYMPHFHLEDDDVLNYCGEEFTSFEALVEQHGYNALNETLIINDLGM